MSPFKLPRNVGSRLRSNEAKMMISRQNSQGKSDAKAKQSFFFHADSIRTLIDSPDADGIWFYLGKLNNKNSPDVILMLGGREDYDLLWADVMLDNPTYEKSKSINKEEAMLMISSYRETRDSVMSPISYFLDSDIIRKIIDYPLVKGMVLYPVSSREGPDYQSRGIVLVGCDENNEEMWGTNATNSVDIDGPHIAYSSFTCPPYCPR